MSSRLFLRLALALVIGMAQSDAEIKGVREYFLRLPRDRHILFTMAVTPEQDVLSFIANADGKWRLSRVHGWLENPPQEETIVIPGLSMGKRSDWSGPWSAVLLVTPDGRFVVCIASGWRNQPRGRIDFVSVIALPEFKLVATLQASGIASLTRAYRTYQVDRGGLLVVQDSTPFARHPGDDIGAGGDQVHLAVVSLPQLAVTAECQYSEQTRTGSPVHRDNEQDCAALLTRVASASLEEFFDGFVKTDEVLRTDRKSTPSGCWFLSHAFYVSRNGKFEREICQQSHRGFWGNPVITKSVENIFSAKSGRQLGSINEPTDSVQSRFASIVGREYLLLMEGGTRLVVYEITD